jgi:hypothetical protein
MPSETPKQANFVRAEYGRSKAGEATKTGMSKEKLGEWVHADSALEHKKKALKGQMSGGEHAAKR